MNKENVDNRAIRRRKANKVRQASKALDSELNARFGPMFVPSDEFCAMVATPQTSEINPRGEALTCVPVIRRKTVTLAEKGLFAMHPVLSSDMFNIEVAPSTHAVSSRVTCALTDSSQSPVTPFTPLGTSKPNGGIMSDGFNLLMPAGEVRVLSAAMVADGNKVTLKDGLFHISGASEPTSFLTITSDSDMNCTVTFTYWETGHSTPRYSHAISVTGREIDTGTSGLGSHAWDGVEVSVQNHSKEPVVFKTFIAEVGGAANVNSHIVSLGADQELQTMLAGLCANPRTALLGVGLWIMYTSTEFQGGDLESISRPAASIQELFLDEEEISAYSQNPNRANDNPLNEGCVAWLPTLDISNWGRNRHFGEFDPSFGSLYGKYGANAAGVGSALPQVKVKLKFCIGYVPSNVLVPFPLTPYRPAAVIQAIQLMAEMPCIYSNHGHLKKIRKALTHASETLGLSQLPIKRVAKETLNTVGKKAGQALLTSFLAMI